MTVIEGDILDVKRGVICHQVNCMGVMGSGIAKQIRDKYPQHYIDYRLADMKLGNIVITEITPDELYVVGVFGQQNYGRGQRHTNYVALAEALPLAKRFADEKGLDLYLPFNFGCGLAGGDWNEVLEIIQWAAPDATIVKLKRWQDENKLR